MADAGIATSALGTAGLEDSPTKLSPRYTVPQRLKFAAIAFVVQKLLLAPVFAIHRLHDFLVPSRAPRPTLIKTYPARRGLHVRIFFPPGHAKNDTTNRLPTLLTIHGGGFVVGTPRDNDEWNATFASRHNFLVVALNYGKAPGSPFPAPIYDLETLIGCVLADESLPIDPSKVALAGWSAGGNLALAVSQLEAVRSRVRAVIPLYPVVDFVTGSETKLLTRRYKPGLGGFRARESDYLMSMAGVFNWAYVDAGVRCDHALLSPYYADRESFPPAVFVIGAEMDMLGQEAWRFACKLAGRKVPEVDEAMGREEVGAVGELVLEGDERFAFEERDEEGGRFYRWLLVPDTIHGFDQEQISRMVRDKVTMEDAMLKRDKVVGLIGEWLLSGPLRDGK
ncbi:Alpha/Beta hydrolase protein [Echria macrotheca]|uniref:Alpha/Beta hydrolase protein n=1 Tax=Echria macrotheca TaxID=438768 RepID=A0AAJ0BKQ9_9PEZI|nr:Alpha/Beta hydrolase protein [Echria macrotheca]